MIRIIPSFDAQTEHVDLSISLAVNQILTANDNATELVIAHEFPNMRLQLHKGRVPFINWWSVFDDIQAVNFKAGIPLTINNVSVPAHTEPFMNTDDVYFYKQKQLVKHVKLVEKTVVSEIDYYDAQRNCIRDVYDDRGFVSTRIWFNLAGHQTKKCWLDPSGQIVMTMDEKGSIKISSRYQTAFNQTEYIDLQTIVVEKILDHFAGEKQIILMEQTIPYFKKLFKTLTSVATQMIVLMPESVSEPIIAAQNTANRHIVFGSEAAKQQYLKQFSQLPGHSHVISYYPSHLNLGISSEQAQSNVVIRYGELQEQQAKQLAARLCEQMFNDDQLQFQVMVNAVAKKHVQFKLWVYEYIQNKYGIYFSDPDFVEFEKTREMAPDASKADVMDFLDEQYGRDQRERISETKQEQIINAYAARTRFQFDSTSSISAKQRLIQDARLFIDLNEIPDDRLQVQALSAGIPQITFGKTDFIKEGVNGFTLKQVDELPHMIDYFVNSLPHWNAALIENVQQIQLHSETSLIHAWEALFNYGK